MLCLFVIIINKQYLCQVVCGAVPRSLSENMNRSHKSADKQVGIEVLMKMWVRHSRQKINMAIGRNKACLVLEESLDSGVNR